MRLKRSKTPFPSELISELTGYSCSFYTLVGHYFNLWKYDQDIVDKPDDPNLDEAIEYVTQLYKLEEPVTSHSWDKLSAVPFIPTSSSGWGFIGKKGDPGNHQEAIRRAVLHLNWWLEGTRSLCGPFRYHPDLAWTRTQLSQVDAPKVCHVWGKAFGNRILQGITGAAVIPCRIMLAVANYCIVEKSTISFLKPSSLQMTVSLESRSVSAGQISTRTQTSCSSFGSPSVLTSPL